ncbi:unnamed protein product, partial [Gongylonema pulchrum]|uniref:Lysine 2,3-aminomutase n=1 Tax=Gongylonema pulchrum TaxID=637853 RepID=A0A183DKU8_9BILA
MNNPRVMIPRLIERLQKKDLEWREVQQTSNELWRSETEKQYAKSLDHQAPIFKHRDFKELRPRNIISQYENLYDERADRLEQGEELYGPHCLYKYPEDMSV